MSDLISRQDALKPFCIAPDGTRIPEVDCDNFPIEFSVEFIKKHLLSLPSADRPTGWIPVSERLPGKNGCYLVSTTGTNNDIIDMAYYIEGMWHKASRIKAWMPLPEPYREDGEACIE